MEEIESLKANLNFSSELLKLLHELKCKGPYHINVIDELHINENAHSRILCKLLRFYSEQGRYELLESLLSIICKKYERDENKIAFSKITIKAPLITQEEERIDLWIRDKDYAIIVENKVYNAEDQEAQLYRYIQKTRDKGYGDEQIFIVYLSSQKGYEPADQSWNGLKDCFSDRYVNLSFREEIRPWLKETILPNIRNKDICLLTAVSQYVDYLDGYFLLRNTDNNMKNEIHEALNKLLGIETLSDEEKLSSINAKIEELQDSTNYLAAYRDDISDVLFKKEKAVWKDKIIVDFPDFNYCDIGYGGVTVLLGNTYYKLYFNNDTRWYCQIEMSELGEKQDAINNKEVNESGIREILYLPRNFSGDRIWKYFGSDYNACISAYNCMKEVAQKLRIYGCK